MILAKLLGHSEFSKCLRDFPNDPEASITGIAKLLSDFSPSIKKHKKAIQYCIDMIEHVIKCIFFGNKRMPLNRRRKIVRNRFNKVKCKLK